MHGAYTTGILKFSRMIYSAFEMLPPVLRPSFELLVRKCVLGLFMTPQKLHTDTMNKKN